MTIHWQGCSKGQPFVFFEKIGKNPTYTTHPYTVHPKTLLFRKPLWPFIKITAMTIRLLLGDQLNPRHSWFGRIEPQVHYVMMEVRQETDYVRHHVQKVLAFFLAMRAFGRHLRAAGHQVTYLSLSDPDNLQDIGQNLLAVFARLGATRFEYQEPDEYRLESYLQNFGEQLGLPFAKVSSEHFLADRYEVSRLFEGKKQYLMETFYRHIRKRYGLLMDEYGEPVGGKWNYDADNRRRYDAAVPVPPPLRFERDVSELLDELRQAGVRTIGHIVPQSFDWAVTRPEALALLRYFTDHLLAFFGTYQDAMSQRHSYLFHSRLSFVINVKLLHPMEVVQAAIEAWKARPGLISLSQVEGFVRQIIGWREYMRGIYWEKMPEYATLNYFGHARPLPEWFWTGETHMNCLRQAIHHSLDQAYAHHIQRLMVTGNFALLAGINPDEVDAWYLGIYADAVQWVQLPNTRGMSQYADGGIVGSKPYVSSANYIDKMSDYCQGCHYDKKIKYGDRACPFNSLYWHFYARHRDQLAGNPRIGMAVVTLDKMKPDERQRLWQQAEVYLDRIEEL